MHLIIHKILNISSCSSLCENLFIFFSGLCGHKCRSNRFRWIFLHYSDCLGENRISVNLLEVDLQNKRSASNTIQTDSSTRKSELSYNLNVVSVNSKTNLSAHTYMFRHAFLKRAQLWDWNFTHLKHYCWVKRVPPLPS